MTKEKKISFLHIDAHTDTFSQLDHFMGAKKSAAHWGAYLVDQGIINPHNSMQIGMRGKTTYLGLATAKFMILGYNVVTMDEFKKRGIKDVINETLEKIGR